MIHFDRQLKTQLSAWKRKARKKTLILKGIRQVGKTTLVKEWGKEKYSNVAYFDMNNNVEWKELFNYDSDPLVVIGKLETIYGSCINPENTLIVLDNIDDCITALSYLQNFSLLDKRYSIIAISSYLDILSQDFNEQFFSHVTIKTLKPLSFKEFLSKTSQFGAASYSHYQGRDHIKNIRKKFHDILYQKFKEYLLSGGMCEAASVYQKTKSLTQVQVVKKKIQSCIEADFLKYNSGVFPKRLYQVWCCIKGHTVDSSMGAFKFSNIRSNSRAREFNSSIMWLRKAGLVHQIASTSGKVNDNVNGNGNGRNIYVLDDMGLYDKLFQNEPVGNASVQRAERLYFLRSIAEKFKFPKLIGKEILVHLNDSLLRILFTSQFRRSSKPKEEYSTNSRIHISNNDLSLSDNVLNIPFFFTDEIVKFLRIAQNQIKNDYFPEKRSADHY